jgi:hypothetical protein
MRLAGMLTERGDLDELRARVALTEVVVADAVPVARGPLAVVGVTEVVVAGLIAVGVMPRDRGQASGVTGRCLRPAARLPC